MNTIKEHRSHFDLPSSAWPRESIYYYCPTCRKVHGIRKSGPAACPVCGAEPLRDVFAEMADRLERTWGFFDETRSEAGSWLFRMQPGDTSPSLWASGGLALGAYAELRAMGFTPPSREPWGPDDEILACWTDAILGHLDPQSNLLRASAEDCSVGGAIASPERYVSYAFEWQLRNRIFMPEVYRLPVGAQANEDYLASVDKARVWLEETWDDNTPWTAGSWTTRVVETHMAIRKDRALEPEDEVIDFVHRWLDDRQDAATGAWFTNTVQGTVECEHHGVVNGIFKLFVTYEPLGWEIPRQREIVDFVLNGTDPEVGFAGSGCSVFDPMQVLYVLRGRGCGHRTEETDEVTAKSFLTFLENWDEQRGWFVDRSWNGEHNLAIPLYMASLLLDHPYMKVNTVYNWREGPIIERAADGVRVRAGITY